MSPQASRTKSAGVFLKARESVLPRYILAIFAAAFCILLIVAGLSTILLNKFQDGSVRTLFWAQTFAGNWSADHTLVDKKILDDREFAVSGAVALVLNNFLVPVILGLVWQLVVERRERMESADAMIVRDFLIKEAFRDCLQEAREKRGAEPLTTDQVFSVLNSAFSKGTSDLEQHLSFMYGPEKAKAITLNFKSRSNIFYENTPG